MATADELRAQIEARRLQVEQAKAVEQEVLRDLEQAKTRQQLRRELERVDAELTSQNRRNEFGRVRRQLVDHDEDGPHVPAEPVLRPTRLHFDADGMDQRQVVHTMDCNAAVVTGEIEWSIKGFSWLSETLEQLREDEAWSPLLSVGGHSFWLTYDPSKSNIGDHSQKGSLAILHEDAPEYSGVVFRYTIWIKSKLRGFVQWGESGSVCTNDSAIDMLFGPDVCQSKEVPAGVFGMTHVELLESEWVIDDVLTAKLRVDVRPNRSYIEEEKSVQHIVVPPPRLGDELLVLLDSGAGSDVTIFVQDEPIHAHSPILSARSEVFQRQFSCGMQESTSKEVTIDDCEPAIFKAFLRYLYSDSFASLEKCLAQKLMAEQAASDSSGSSNAVAIRTARGAKMPMLQQLLALSHKYQLSRLQLWCERELCECISIEDVCSLLCQANLYESRKLEERCLDFIKAHMDEVVRTDAFVSLSQEWPQASLKITLHVARVSETNAAAAMDKQQNARKRRRDD